METVYKDEFNRIWTFNGRKITAKLPNGGELPLDIQWSDEKEKYVFDRGYEKIPIKSFKRLRGSGGLETEMAVAVRRRR